MFSGFGYAFRGLWLGLRRERHMRVHLCVAVCVVYAGLLVGLEVWAWCACLASIGLIMGLELVNAALEQLSDRVTTDRDESIRMTKDLAAGAVLIASMVAAAIGLLVFLRPDTRSALWSQWMSGHIYPFAALTLLALFFIGRGTKK